MTLPTKPLLVVAVLLAVALAGCGMTNDEIIAEHKKCAAAGMRTERFVNGFTSTTDRITCVPKESP